MSIASPFAHISAAPPDPILGLSEAYLTDKNPHKVNLGVGVYQNSAGRVPILEVVREAERRLIETEDTKSYLPIDGVPAFRKLVQELILGKDSPIISEQRALTVQALGGTGGLKIGADFLRRFFPESKVFISTPSWENHRAIFESAGFEVGAYPYYDSQTQGLDFEAMKAGIAALPARSIVVLHACCHNPSGVDPSPAQWDELVKLFQGSELIPFLDFAYQGFGDGIEQDAYAVRAFANAGIRCVISNSFSKSFSLYRERVGGMTIITASAEETARVQSQVKRVIRTNYSNPAAHGGQVVALVLGDPALRARWEQELTEMRERIHKMRTLLAHTLKEKGVERDFGFIAQQRGMFSFMGIPVDAVRRLRSEFGLYIVDSSRICVAALNERNIGYVCDSIAKVL